MSETIEVGTKFINKDMKVFIVTEVKLHKTELTGDKFRCIVTVTGGDKRVKLFIPLSELETVFESGWLRIWKDAKEKK